MSWCSANGICGGSCRSTSTTTTGPGPTYRWPRTHPSHGVCSRRARAGWWRCPAWVGSITNTSGARREPIGRISGRHKSPCGPLLKRREPAFERDVQRLPFAALILDEKGASMFAKDLLEFGPATARERDVLL